MQEKPVVRHCPVCSTAMVAEATPANSGDRMRLSCFNCGAVVVSQIPEAGPRSDRAAIPQSSA